VHVLGARVTGTRRDDLGCVPSGSDHTRLTLTSVEGGESQDRDDRAKRGFDDQIVMRERTRGDGQPWRGAAAARLGHDALTAGAVYACLPRSSVCNRRRVTACLKVRDAAAEGESGWRRPTTAC
jgi:hypothetical protein